VQSAAVVRIGNARTDPCLGHSRATRVRWGGVREDGVLNNEFPHLTPHFPSTTNDNLNPHPQYRVRDRVVAFEWRELATSSPLR